MFYIIFVPFELPEEIQKRLKIEKWEDNPWLGIFFGSWLN
jgi:hypothetical protein